MFPQHVVVDLFYAPMYSGVQMQRKGSFYDTVGGYDPLESVEPCECRQCKMWRRQLRGGWLHRFLLWIRQRIMR